MTLLGSKQPAATARNGLHDRAPDSLHPGPVRVIKLESLSLANPPEPGRVTARSRAVIHNSRFTKCELESAQFLP